MHRSNVKSGSQKQGPFCANAGEIRYGTAATSKDAINIKTFARIANLKNCTSTLQISSDALMLYPKVTRHGHCSMKDMTITNKLPSLHTKR